MPSERAFSAVRSDVGVPMTLRPPRTRAASSSRNISAVEPVPSPSFMPSLTNSTALAAATRFISVWSTAIAGT